MQAGELKPILTALAMPPTGLLLLILLGLVLAAGKRWRLGVGVAAVGTTALWILSCHGFAMLLAGSLLPQVRPATPDRLRGVQAIVVLGGGVVRDAPEYGMAQPNGYLLARLRYGARLARSTGKPLAFSGGVGWASVDGDIAPEGEVARRVLSQDYGLEPRWIDAESRDTHENALRTRDLLAPQGIRRIALVTHAWHMPRAVREFESAGFTVVPAPTGFASRESRPLLEWLPSADGLMLSRLVLREAAGRVVQAQ
jgi:uncharacterized SAM-binding protein YcdF (DUF218 family)